MKKKRQRTRKQKTMLRGALFLLLFVLLIHSHALCLTPSQSIRAVEALYGLEPTELIAEKGDFTLSENQNTLLLIQHQPFHSPLWNVNGSQLQVQTKPDHPVCAIIAHRWNSEDPDMRYHLAGTLDLEGAASVRAYCTPDTEYNGTPLTLTAEVESTADGRLYFWSLTILPVDSYVIPQHLDVLDDKGNILTTTEISWQ